MSDAEDQHRRNSLARAHFGLARIPRAHEGLSGKGAAFINETFPRMSQEWANLSIANALSMFDIDEARKAAIDADRTEPNQEEIAEREGGGRLPYKELDKLLTALIAVWRREFPFEKPITRSNSSGDGQQYHGPLLDFVERLLTIEGVGWTYPEGTADFRSNKSLGKRLLRLAK